MEQRQRLVPRFRKMGNGEPVLGRSNEAKEKQEPQVSRTYKSASQQQVHCDALKSVRAVGGDVNDKKVVLGRYKLQMGTYRGQTFMWVLENDLGWAAALAVSSLEEVKTPQPLSSKFALAEYMQYFPESRQAIEIKKKERGIKFAPKIAQPKPRSMRTSVTAQHSAIDAGASTCRASAVECPAPAETGCSVAKATAGECFASTSRATAVDCPALSSTDPLTSRAIPVECPASFSSEPDAMDQLLYATTSFEQSSERVLLPSGWKETLPKFDHAWISRTFFACGKAGNARFKWHVVDKLFWRPPPKPTSRNQPPRMNRYFARPLLLWFPRKFLKALLVCFNEECRQNELTSAGLYPRTRSILTMDSYYNLAAEYLECSQCKKKYISWSDCIIRQLDVSHQECFPALLTYRYGCDQKVVAFMRFRGVGNSSTHLQTVLANLHCERWMRDCSMYLTDCLSYKKCSVVGDSYSIEEPPEQIDVPSVRWLLSVHAKDVVKRLPQLKALITSTYGTILKIDSTKKVSNVRYVCALPVLLRLIFSFDSLPRSLAAKRVVPLFG